MVLHLLLLATVLAGHLTAAAPPPPPYQSICKAIWLFSGPCDDVATKLVNEIKSRRHFTLESSSNTTIRSRHGSRDSPQSENVDFDLHGTKLMNGCEVYATSASIDQTFLFNNGLNYCNLYDLVTGSGLDLEPGFREMVSEWSCLGYSTAACRPKFFK
ncbi:uncharacterized protein ACB058_015113 [Synchiropus picturatus]